MGSRSEYLMGEAQFLKNIGFRIQYFRKKANLSQEQLAEKSDLSYSTIKKLCDGLGISIEEFFSSELFQGLDQEVK